LAAVDDSETHADALADLNVNVGANASLTTGGGDINISGHNSNASLASINSAGGGLVSVSSGNALPTTAGSTVLTFDGDVGDGDPSGGNFNVLLEAFSTADAALSSFHGGAVQVTDAEAISDSKPTMTLNFASGTSDIDVDGSIH